MLSSTARRTSDLRKHLPWVLGFPKKRGPGNLLDPDRAQQKTWFAFNFAAEIRKGNDPVTARRNACDALDGKAADVDDKTLRLWLLEEFNLKKAPANTEQWKKTIDERWFLPVLMSIDQLSRRLHFMQTESRETPP